MVIQLKEPVRVDRLQQRRRRRPIQIVAVFEATVVIPLNVPEARSRPITKQICCLLGIYPMTSYKPT